MGLNETPADRAREASVCAALEAAWDVRAHMMPERFPFDCLLVNGRTCTPAEIKSRARSQAEYPSFGVDLAKVARLAHWGRLLDAPGLLVVAYADVIAWLNVRCDIPAPFDVRLGGRTDRGDPADLDALVYLPHALFKVLP